MSPNTIFTKANYKSLAALRKDHDTLANRPLAQLYCSKYPDNKQTQEFVYSQIRNSDLSIGAWKASASGNAGSKEGEARRKAREVSYVGQDGEDDEDDDELSKLSGSDEDESQESNAVAGANSTPGTPADSSASASAPAPAPASAATAKDEVIKNEKKRKTQSTTRSPAKKACVTEAQLYKMQLELVKMQKEGISMAKSLLNATKCE